ncbi:MAG: tetratricopeptide repeat protein [Desulfovibrionaceae bacterium]|nr:tetratricopeptide repeat protein [Desulfovibrionaceae bacterium]
MPSFSFIIRHCLFLACCAGICLPSIGCAGAPVVPKMKHMELTEEASLTYGILLLEQSMPSGDQDGVLEACRVLLSLRDSQPRFFLEAGAWLLNHDAPGAARTLLAEAVAKFPDNSDIVIALAETILAESKNNDAGAFEVLEQFRSRHPDSIAVSRELAVLHTRMGRYDIADKMFRQIPVKYQDPHTRYCHAGALSAMGRSAAAKRELRAAIEDLPDFREAVMELGRLLEQEKNDASALEVYLEFLEREPEDAEILLRAVSCALRLGDVPGAVKLIDEGGENRDFLIAACARLLDAKAYREAEKLLDRLDTMPGAPEERLFLRAAVAFELHGDMHSTADLLSQISSSSVLYDRALKLLIQINVETGLLDEALAYAVQGKTLYPEDRDFRLAELYILWDHLQYAEALEASAEALMILPEDETILFLHATFLDKIGRKEEAFAVMERILKANPDSYQALNYIGYSLAEQGRDLERALTLLKHAVSLRPDLSYILDSLAWAQLKSGQIDEAWSTIRKSVSLPDSSDAVIWEHYGDIAFASGRVKEAVRGWKKALSLNPENTGVLLEKIQSAEQ